jgi:hypothetical protein
MSQEEKRAGLIAQLLEYGFHRQRGDRLAFHHIDVSLLTFDGRVRVVCNDKEHTYTSRTMDTTILKQVLTYADKIKADIAAFGALCEAIEIRLYEMGVHTVQPSKMPPRKNRRPVKKRFFDSPWTAAFSLKLNGDRLFSLHYEDEGVIEMDYLHEYKQVKTVDDVIKVLQETWPEKRVPGTVCKKAICTFGPYKLFLPYIFKYGITTIKEVECIVQQTSSDPVARELASLEQLTRKYFKINLRNKPSLNDQLAMALVGKVS